MSCFIEAFYYGNIEAQECCSELKSELKKELNSLTEKEETLTSKLNGEEKNLFVSKHNVHIALLYKV